MKLLANKEDHLGELPNGYANIKIQHTISKDMKLLTNKEDHSRTY